MSSNFRRKNQRNQPEQLKPAIANPPGRPRSKFAGKFGAFITAYKAENLATDLDVDVTCVYAWMRGDYNPSIRSAVAIIDVARRFGTKLTLEDVFVRELQFHLEGKHEKTKALASA